MKPLNTLFRKKKILITQNSIQGLQGSEIVALELADFFQNAGAEVKVFTWHYGEPMWGCFREKGIEVTDDEEDDFFEDCDYVWVQHQVLPQRLIRKLAENKPRKKPQFIFIHMSGLKDVLLEQPYIYDLEATIASKILFVSQEVSEMFDEMEVFDETCPRQIFPNPAPVSYTEMQTPSEQLRRVLIVSNHPPEEILNAKKILCQNGIEAVSLGQNTGQYSRVTADLLDGYDAVVTIGKTVQYCLVGGKPVYVYDKFGGPGYLTAKNFELAKSKNFSGRGFKKKEAKTIADEVVRGYNTARKYSLENKIVRHEDFLLGTNLAKVFSDLGSSKYIHMDKKYWQYVLTAEHFARERVVIGWQYHNTLQENSSLKNTVAMTQGRIRELEFLLNNALSFPGSRYVKWTIRLPKKILHKVKNIHKKQMIRRQKQF